MVVSSAGSGSAALFAIVNFRESETAPEDMFKDNDYICFNSNCPNNAYPKNKLCKNHRSEAAIFERAMKDYFMHWEVKVVNVGVLNGCVLLSLVLATIATKKEALQTESCWKRQLVGILQVAYEAVQSRYGGQAHWSWQGRI